MARRARFRSVGVRIRPFFYDLLIGQERATRLAHGRSRVDSNVVVIVPWALAGAGALKRLAQD